RCVDAEWLTRIYGPEDFSPTDNVGIKSIDGLVDVDCDCLEAVHFANAFLPKTPAIYGRASRRRSHWLFRCPEITDPLAFKDLIEKKRLTKIRVKHQSMAPGSKHPEGEKVEWDDPAFTTSALRELEADKALLTRMVQLCATGAMMARHCN